LLHIVETTEDFQTTIREFYVDLRGPKVSLKKPEGLMRYERMRVRAGVLRHVLRHGQPWEEISIGFQARFFRDPDQYNFDFWNHFQNLLPTEPPTF
jgi:hypothetical protein